MQLLGFPSNWQSTIQTDLRLYEGPPGQDSKIQYFMNLKKAPNMIRLESTEYTRLLHPCPQI